ncbi:MAG TPA: hypothetical protein VGA01_03770 [Candidatus Binatia bacterium]
MGNVMTIEERIMERFLEKLKSDQFVPAEVVDSIRILNKEGQLKDAQAILRAIGEGVKEHAKNSAP